MSFVAFSGNGHPSLGVELELQLIDARSMALTGAIDKVRGALPPEYQEFVAAEFHECCVEVTTGVCQDLSDVERDLRDRLAALAAAAARHGVVLGWGGTHPFSHWRDQPIVPTPRYRALANFYRESLTRQVTFGMHVHVGVSDGDTAVHVCNRLAEHLPLLLALSGNSPFWCGRATGLLSHRIDVISTSPVNGLPPIFSDWNAFGRFVERLIASELIRAPKDLWWDVRPSPSHGTVEVRICDMPADLPTVLGLAAMIQCLVFHLASEDRDAANLDEAGWMIVRQNRWRAARFGLEADLIDPRTGRRVRAREACRSRLAQLDGVAQTLGCLPHVRFLASLTAGPNGAEQQLAVYARTRDLRDVVRQRMLPDVSQPRRESDARSPKAEAHDGGLISWVCDTSPHAEQLRPYRPGLNV